MFNQFDPEGDFPIPPVNPEDDDDDEEEDESSNSLARPLPRPFLMDIADRFVVMPIGANAVVTHTMRARRSSGAEIVIFIFVVDCFIVY